MRFDKGILLTVIFLIGLGLVQVYSSSFIFAIENYGDGLYIFKRQLTFSILALAILFLTLYTPWKVLNMGGVFLWFFAVFLIILTLIPEFAIKAGGASRWVKMPFGQRFEPGELLKFTYPFLMAFMIYSHQNKKKEWSPLSWIFRILLICCPLLLLLKQPDFGTFAICVGIIFGMCFAFGLKWRYIVGGIALILPMFYVLIVQVPYRYARIAAYLDPWSDPTEKGFQVIQSMLSFYSGGFWGVGLGQGQGKLFFLPEAHTDFTLAVLGEEMGFIGMLAVILVYGYLVFKGFQIAIKCSDLKKRGLAIGLTLTFMLSVFINFGVVLGLLPTKGLTLPFLSYGGSSLIVMAFAFGCLLNIDRQIPQKRVNKYPKYYKL